MKYKIIMQKNDFFKIHNRIAVKNLEIKDEEVSFEVELGSLNILRESGYPFHLIDSIRIKFQSFMKKYYLLLIGVLFLFSVLYINSFRVNKINFNMKTPINSLIETRIKKSYKKILCFNFSNLNYTAFSKTLRLEYVEYPYIEVYSKNNNIFVDIYSYDDEYPKAKDQNASGDIIAKKDAVIDEFYIYNGNLLISKNKYVKEGEVLISGSTNNNKIEAKGLVMGYTYEKTVIEVLKKEEEEVSTGRSQKYQQIHFMNWDFPFQKKDSYSSYDTVEQTLFNVFDIFYVKQIEEKEKNAIIKENDEASATLKAEGIIKENFEKNKINDKEKIMDCKKYLIEETEDKYLITFILKKLESIGEFRAY